MSYRPCGGLGGAGLLEGDVEGVRTSVVCIGGDGGRRRQSLEGGAGLGVGRGRRHVILGVIVIVRTGGRGAAVLIHTVKLAQVCVLRL